MGHGSHIAFEIKDKFSRTWSPSPVSIQETGMSDSCASFIYDYVSERGEVIEKEVSSPSMGMMLSDIAKKDDIISLNYGTPECRWEARVMLITVMAHHYATLRKCATELRVVTISKHN